MTGARHGKETEDPVFINARRDSGFRGFLLGDGVKYYTIDLWPKENRT